MNCDQREGVQLFRSAGRLRLIHPLFLHSTADYFSNQFKRIADTFMSMTFLLKTGLLIVLISCGAGCSPDPTTEVAPATAAYLEGNTAFEAMDYDEAMAQYNQALGLDSTMALAYEGRGRLYWVTFQFDRAVPDLTRALELNPDLPWSYYFRGASLLNLQQFEAGMADLTKAIASEVLPDDFMARARHLRAIGHMNLEQYEDAIIDVSACIDLEPDHPVYRFERATLYEAVGRPTDAIADYESFVSIHEHFLTLNEEATQKADSADVAGINRRLEEVRQKLAVLREAASS